MMTKTMETRRFEYVRILGYQSVTFLSTDPTMIKWFVDSIKKFHADCKVSTTKLPDGEIFAVRVEGLEKVNLNSRDMAFMIFRELCHHGWEPFGYDVPALDAHYISYHLRRDVPYKPLR
jgi:hypothetical protein